MSLTDLLKEIFKIINPLLPLILPVIISSSFGLWIAKANKKGEKEIKQEENKQIEVEQELKLIDQLRAEVKELRGEVRTMRIEFEDLERKHDAAKKYIFEAEMHIMKGSPPPPPPKPDILK